MRFAVSRRRFVNILTFGIVGIWSFSSCKGSRKKYRFFTDEEASLVEAITEQIVPTDEWPGAKEAGVLNFIDKQLAGTYRRFQNVYRRNLAALSEFCRVTYGKKFEALEPDFQLRLLENMESGQLNWMGWDSKSARDFFGLIRDHCMQGFYGSPRHGGNKDYISYRMLGIDYPLIIGQNRYK